METYCQNHHCPKYFECKHVGTSTNECPSLPKLEITCGWTQKECIRPQLNYCGGCPNFPLNI